MIFTKIISKTVVFIVTNAFYIYEKLLCGKKFEKRVTTKFFKNFIISLCSNCLNRHRTVFFKLCSVRDVVDPDQRIRTVSFAGSNPAEPFWMVYCNIKRNLVDSYM